MYNNNVERVLKFLGWNIEDFEKTMKEISEKSRTIIEVRWGLLGESKICPNYKTLDKKLGVENSKTLFVSAMEELVKTRLANVLVDSKEFSLDQAARISILARCIFGKEKLPENYIIGKELMEILKTLTPREEHYLVKRYGLTGEYKPCSLDDVCRYFNFTRERGRQIEGRALRKLRHPSRVKKFHLESKLKSEKALIELEAAETKLEKDKTEFSDLNFSVRTYNCLKRAGIITVEDLLNYPEEKISSIRNLGERGVEEVLKARSMFR